MDELHGVFSTKDGRKVEVSVLHDEGKDAIFFCEYVLHTPEGQALEAQDQEDDRLRLRVKEDRDPGTESVECFVAGRGQLLKYTLVANVDGHEMHEDCVTGGVNTLSWRVTRPKSPKADPVAPGGETKTLEVGGGVGGSGEATPAQV